MRLVFNKESSGSVQSDAADRPTDFQIDNTHIHSRASSLGRLHHSYFNNGFHSVLLLAMVTYRSVCMCVNELFYFILCSLECEDLKG